MAIRVFIVGALVGAALWMLAVAYAPQRPTPIAAQNDLVCPPPVRIAEPPETVGAPPPACIVQPTVTPSPPRVVVTGVPQQRTVAAKKDEKRSTPKKPTVQPSVRTLRAPARAEKAQPTAHKAPTVRSDPPSPLTPMLAQTNIAWSPFGDMHGQ